MSSLLQEKCQSPTTDDINKPPEDSSDEVALGQERSEEASDSEFDSPKGKRRTTWLESGQSESPKQEASFDGKPLGNPPSNMRNSSFTSKRSFGNHNGSQRTPRGSQDDVKDEEEDFAGTWCSSQRKRHKAGYGSSSQKLPTLPNIHTSMVGQQKKATSKTSHAEAEKGTNGSKRTKLDGALSALDKEKPQECQTSPRAQRASRRSSEAFKEASKALSKPVFNIPRRISPKLTRPKGSNLGPKFRAPPKLSPEMNSTIVSASKRESLHDADLNSLKAGDIKIAVTAEDDRVGLGEQLLKLADLSTTPSSFDETAASSPLSSPPDSPTTVKCPICKGRVQRNILEEFDCAERLNISQQVRFCKAHKIQSAREEWKGKGYPPINWQGLDLRLKQYHPALEDVLSGRKPSFYRNVFEDLVKSGKHRTLQKSLMQNGNTEGLSPGYYGSRGSKIMAENVMLRFSSKIRCLAASDKLIALDGVSGYVQTVLVPELAVLLVKDDMGVNEDCAREILRDTVDIGNLLNEEEDEIIHDPSPDLEVKREVVVEVS